MPALYVPEETFEKINEPSDFDFVDCTTFPAAFSSCTVTPPSPSSPFSTTPGLPPPGLKSRHTVPTISPSFDGGVTACTELFGTWSGGMPVTPRSATPPGRSGVFRIIPPPFGTSAGVDGSADCSGPAGLKIPETVFPSALIAPRFGSCWYMIRHVTPVANAEIAIGRNTAVLNATAQRTRSVSTAKTSPTAVTIAGTTATQMALFLIAVVRFDVVKSVL